jgi:SRSO17 transposase
MRRGIANGGTDSARRPAVPGSIGKVENGVVSVHSLWADERRYYPLEVEPYTPAHWFARGKADAAFRTKPQIALELVRRAVQSQVPFRAVVADSFYGENAGFVQGLEQLELGYVLALKPSHAWWHPQEEIGSVAEVARLEPWQRKAPGAWQKVTRRSAMDIRRTGGRWMGRLAHMDPPKASDW